jgi:DNA helicase-2/ATP-dependent DNA helicase PcrA
MRRQNIPYRIYGGLSFYQRKEIKDVIAYFRLVANPNDEEALRRIINYPTRGIGDTTVAKIAAAANTHGVSLWNIVSQPVLFGLQVSKATATRLETFRQQVETWAARITTDDAFMLGSDIIRESGISQDLYSSHNPDDITRQENLQEFLGGMQDFVSSRREEDMGDQVSLSHYLQEVALLTDLDSEGTDDGPKVSLMTIHSAKGLEFRTVFVVGLEENIFPSPLSADSMRALEEERRLLYVAITRAERHCILTCAQNRFRYGRMEYDTPSRFIRDIDPSLLRVEDSCSSEEESERPQRSPRRSPWQSDRYTQNPRPVATQFRADPMPRAIPVRPAEKAPDPLSPSFRRLVTGAEARRFKPVAEARSAAASPVSTGAAPSTASSATLHEGSVIEHQRFGRGTVVAIEGSGENQKATVNFSNAGTKQLLLKFAKFTVVKG